MDELEPDLESADHYVRATYERIIRDVLTTQRERVAIAAALTDMSDHLHRDLY